MTEVSNVGAGEQRMTPVGSPSVGVKKVGQMCILIYRPKVNVENLRKMGDTCRILAGA